MYDVERFGIVNVGNPKHADILVVTGSVNNRNVRVLKNIYNQIPDPKAVVAVGACACSGGIFKDCYNVVGGIDKVIPVDVYVPGCCPRPEAIIDGIVMAVGKFDEKAEQMKKNQNGNGRGHDNGNGHVNGNNNNHISNNGHENGSGKAAEAAGPGGNT